MKVEMLKDIEAIIFDLDGTLVDSMWMWRDIDIEFLGKFGHELPETLQDEIEGMSFSETAQYFKDKFNLPVSVESIKNDWNDMAYDIYTNRVTLKPGIEEFLSYIKNKGIKVGIASSNSIELVEATLKAHNIDNCFDAIHTSCEVSTGKPCPDIYLLVSKSLNVEPEKCLVFEDVIQGIMAGKNANMRVCAVEDDFSKKIKKEKLALADYYITDFRQIISAYR